MFCSKVLAFSCFNLNKAQIEKTPNSDSPRPYWTSGISSLEIKWPGLARISTEKTFHIETPLLQSNSVPISILCEAMVMPAFTETHRTLPLWSEIWGRGREQTKKKKEKRTEQVGCDGLGVPGLKAATRSDIFSVGYLTWQAAPTYISI